MIIALLLSCSVVALAGAAFCAGAETGFLSVSRARILHLAREGGQKAAKVQKAIQDMGRTTTTLLIGNNIASVTYSSATAAISARLFGDNVTASAIWGFFAAFVVLYASEFMPKLLFAARPLRRTLAIAKSYEVMSFVLSPITAIAMMVTSVFVPKKEQKDKLTMMDLVRILQDRKDGVCLSEFESALISRLVVLRAKGRKITSESILSTLRDYE